MSNQLIVARAKFKFGFVLFIALCLVSMNILLNHPESSSMSSSSLFSTMQQFRLLLSEEEVETPRPRTQHFENDRGIDKKILTPQNSVEQRHLNGGKNSTFVIKYNNRWLHRFRQATRRNNLGGIFFFRHIRKVSWWLFQFIHYPFRFNFSLAFICHTANHHTSRSFAWFIYSFLLLHIEKQH